MAEFDRCLGSQGRRWGGWGRLEGGSEKVTCFKDLWGEAREE